MPHRPFPPSALPWACLLPLLLTPLPGMAAEAEAGPLGAVEQAWERAHAAVVMVRCNGGLGAGFLFHSNRHVATAYHVVDSGRRPQVRVAGREEPITARVVATDWAHDVALLELDEPLEGVVPLEAGRPDLLPIGTPMAVIGHPHAGVAEMVDELEGTLAWSLTQGVLSGRSDDLLQTDAAVNGGNSGGPVLDADGRVLGVVSFHVAGAEGLGFAVRVERLVDLLPVLEHPTPFHGEWYGSMGLLSGVQLAGGAGALGSIGLSASVVGWDRFVMDWRYYALFADDTEEEDTVWTRTRGGFGLETSLGYRFLLLEDPVFPLYLTTALGGQFGLVTTKAERTVGSFSGAGCDPAVEACDFETWLETERDTALSLRPVANARLGFGPGSAIELGYTFSLDPVNPAASSHLVYVGTSFAFGRLRSGGGKGKEE